MTNSKPAARPDDPMLVTCPTLTPFYVVCHLYFIEIRGENNQGPVAPRPLKRGRAPGIPE